MGRAPDSAAMAAASWRLCRVGRTRLGVRARRHGPQYAARVHWRAELRACGLLTLRYLAHSTPLAMLNGTLLGGLAGTLFGLLIVRRRGVYFAMCTIAFGQLWYYLAYSWNDFTGGFDGLRDFHREPIGFGPFTLDITDGGTRFYFFLLAVFAAALALLGILVRSPFGHTLRAIRENERRARFLAIPVERQIWLSFSLSCFFTALAGTLYA